MDTIEWLCLAFIVGLPVWLVGFALTWRWLDRRAAGDPLPEGEGLVLDEATEQVHYAYADASHRHHVIRKGVCRVCKVPVDDLLSSKGTQS